MRKNNLVLGIILVVVALQFVSAIGVTPGRTTFDFKPGMHEEVSFSIINSEHKDMSVVFMVRGDLADYITLTQAYAEFSSSEESKSFSYAVDLPADIKLPGKHEAEIVALEMPKDIKEQGAFVGATIAVTTQLHVYVPYPSKYAEVDVSIIEQEDGKTVFLIPLVNRGELDIVNAKAVIDVYTSLNEKVVSIESESIAVNSLSRGEIMVEWDSREVNPGKYLAAVAIVYDNEVINLQKDFSVGEMSLEIIEILIEDFELGGIAKFESLVENKWSSELDNVHLNIIVYNNKGEVMADFKSPMYDVLPLSKKELVSYWDTAGVHEGTYDGKLILKYGGRSTDRQIQMKITDDFIEIFGLTGHVIVKKKGGLNINNLLLIGLGFLALANLVWFLIVRRLMKKR